MYVLPTPTITTDTLLKNILFTVLLIWTGNVVHGQINNGELVGGELNTIKTSVAFLSIAPDARAAGLGDVGAASTPDVNSQYWNIAKYAFIEKKGGFAMSFTPWLRELIPDINLAYLSGYYRLNDKQVVSGSLKYFSLGNIVFTNLTGNQIGQYNPKEFAFDAGYSRLFTDHLSMGVGFRYIHSDLTAGQNTADGQETQPGQSLAADLGLYYQNDMPIGQRNMQMAFGVNISNIGTPISYTEDAEKTPIPTNLRIGQRFEYFANDHHSISLNVDMNKLLVPTSPIIALDSATGDYDLVHGKQAPESILAGMFQSFNDAPGALMTDGTRSVFLEEMFEIAYSIGVEYNFDNLLFLRSGYFHEHASKGNRKYWTAGLGLKNRIFTLDISYLIPTNGQNSYLAKTFRITIIAEFGRNSFPPLSAS